VGRRSILTTQIWDRTTAPRIRAGGAVVREWASGVLLALLVGDGLLQALIASVEGLVMLCLLLASIARLRSVPRLARDRPYIMLALVYTLLFCMAFSSLGNFGILTRQRVQLLPIALVLLALPSGPVRDGTLGRRAPVPSPQRL
jgi:hypothetical protein